MDVLKKLEEIKAHFENISAEEFEANLIKAGFNEIEPCADSDIIML